MKNIIIYVTTLTVIIFNNDIFAQAIWNQTEGPCGGNIILIATDYKGNLYAITEDYVLFKSTNNGDFWQKKKDSVTTIAFDSSHNIYLSIYGQEMVDGWRIEIYDDELKYKDILVEDKYATWRYLEQIVLTNKDYILINNPWSDLIMSSDNGNSWNSIYEEPYNTVAVDSNENIVLTYMSGTVGQSSDYGKSWNYIHLDSNQFHSGIFNVVYNKKFNRFITSGIDSIIYYSTDGGINWMHSSQIMPLNYIRGMAVNSEGDTFIGGDSLFFYSSDGGDSWNVMGGFSGFNMSSIVCKGDSIFTGNYYNGIICSGDMGKTVTIKNKGLKKAHITDLKMAKNGYLFATSESGIFRSTNEGMDWEQVKIAKSYTNTIYAILCLENNVIYAGAEDGLYKSTNDGSTWQKLNFPGSCSAIVQSESGTIYAGHGYVYNSNDGGLSWQIVSSEMLGWIKSIAAFGDNYVLVGTHSSGIYFTEDNCKTWRRLPVYGIEDYGSIVKFDNSGNLYINISYWCVGGGTWRSLDTGKTFEKLTTPFDALDFMELDNEGNLFAGYWHDVYYSKDKGSTWNLINKGLEDVSVSSFFPIGDNNKGFLGTFHDGVFKCDELMDIAEQQVGNNGDYKIFPNPANDYFIIKGNVNKIQITLYDIIGNEILNQEYAGSKVDISNLQKGVFYLVIRYKSSNIQVLQLIKY